MEKTTFIGALWFVILTKYYSSDWIKGMWLYGRQERCIQVFVGRPEGKRSLGKPRSKWETNNKNIKIDLQKGRWGEFEQSSFGPGKGLVAGTSESSSKPSGSIKFKELLD
jgi:hypothetical protein